MSPTINKRFFFALLIGVLTLFLIAPQSVVHAAYQQQAVSTQPTSLNAPAASDDSDLVTEKSEDDVIEEEENLPETLFDRSVNYFGRLHPVAVHFPIAFLLGAMFMQWLFILTRRKHIPPIVTTMLWMGALGAAAAATLGWAYSYDYMYHDEDEQILCLHRWLGTSTAIAAVLILILKHYVSYFSKPVILAFLLTALAALVGAAGYYGGSLLYGADHFTEF